MVDKSVSERLLPHAKGVSGAYNRLYELVQALRAPGGCPWDREQNPLSMRRDLIEECFEASDAISQNDAAHAKEELADVALNTVMISYMYEQEGAWRIEDSINELCDKLIRRHPHVFPESSGAACMEGDVSDSKQVLANWDKIKDKVEGREGKSVLDSVPEGFPPMMKASKYQKKAAKRGFEWASADDAEAKIYEELNELKSAAPDEKEAEAGDLIFALINYIRMQGIDVNLALDRANRKFYKRFTYIEESLESSGKKMEEVSLEELKSLWNQAKSKE